MLLQQKRVEGDREDDKILLEIEIEYTFFFFLRKEIMFLEENTKTTARLCLAVLVKICRNKFN
jgi:hypothetical protein